MKKLGLIIVIIAVILAGCGGSGGSSSSANTSLFTGSYQGTFTLVGTALGVSASESGRLFISINNSGEIRIFFDDELAAVGPIFSGGRYNITASIRNAGLPDCASGQLTISGNATGNRVTGRISSANVICSGIPFNFTGSLDAQKTTASLSRNTSRGAAFKRLLRRFY